MAATGWGNRTEDHDPTWNKIVSQTKLDDDFEIGGWLFRLDSNQQPFG